MATECKHIEQAGNPEARTDGCEECLKMGAQWVHLRRCLECGHVGCCDSSPNKHATKHFHQTKHPVIQSFEPGETWVWCFEDKLMMDDRPGQGDSARV
ncbi:UBP-type zinc finger domain-containing protein [Myxococcus sp. AM011]|uniref:ubiquitin carboxyl-terminal hydrolase 14 n=1 Tax=Myxococcus sp. AM011 TaxID=2745200 RepID=UPI0015954616|nr:UBP-type zinc finger domain-containing protein [Myxococcus sp. AM011]NVJ21151.1 UBP-type zinc finger domain-containing protein [Myxococcus sp. AM011]